MEKYFNITIAGIERKLPICPISDTKAIAAFVAFSDVEINVACAKEIIARSPDFDIILTIESKGITFAYEMARQTSKPYILIRKVKKLYMDEPVEMQVKSITTEQIQSLYLDKKDFEKMKNKKVLILDDVISTGNSVGKMEQIVKMAGGVVAGKAAVLAEGDATKRTDIIYLEKLPIIDIV